MSVYTLFHARGCGSVFPLTLLRLFGLEHNLITFDYDGVTERRLDVTETADFKAFVKANPLLQFPTLITPDGTVMTEMAGIALYLNHKHGKDTVWSTVSLSDSQLAALYRWFVFIPGNIYPTITINEFPQRYITVPDSSPVDAKVVYTWIQEKVSAKRKETFLLLEDHLGKAIDRSKGPFVLGTTVPTILDIYVTLVVHYSPHPRYAWFTENCPSLYATVKETLRIPIIREVFKENGLDDFID